MENPNCSEQEPRTDVEKYRYLAALSYVFNPVALLMLLLDPKSSYIRHHLNQVICLFIWNAACSIVLIIPLLGWLAGGVGAIAGFVFMIIAVVKTLRREYCEIPIIGRLRIIPEA